MESSGVGSSVSIQPLQNGGAGQKVGGDEKAQASFSSGNRTLSKTDDTVSIQTAGNEESLEPSVDDKSLSERKTENITDKKPGRMKQAMSWFGAKAKAKAKASGLKESAANKWEAGKNAGKSAGKAVVRGAVNFAHNPKATAGNAAASTALYARGKYTSAKAKGVSALQSAGAGLKAFKENPKDTLKAGGAKISGGLKSIKNRAASIPKSVKNRMPSRPKSFSLPGLKSLFKRSATTVPPSPSLSVKNAMSISTQKIQQLSSQVKDAGETLQQARSDKANLKNLSQLIEGSSKLYKSGVKGEVSWNGETVKVSGKGVERARSLRAAVRFVIDNKAAIQAGLETSKEVVTDLKAGNKDLKAEMKQSVKTQRKQASTSEKESYTEKLTDLKSTRSSIKERIVEAKKLAQEAAAEGKTEASESRKSLRMQMKVDNGLLKELEGEVKAEQKLVDQQMSSIRKDLSTLKSAVKKYQGKLEKATTEYAKKAAEGGLTAAREQRDQLLQKIETIQIESASRMSESQQTIKNLTDSLETNKQAITLTKIKGADSSTFEALKEQWQAAKNELEQNTADIRALQKQHKVDQQAINNIKT